MSISFSEEKVEIEINIQNQEIQQNEPDDSITVRFKAENNIGTTLNTVLNVRNEPDMIGTPWNTGLFDCHENETNATMTSFLPCVTFGQIAEVVDGGELSCHLGSFIYLWLMSALCSHWVIGSNYRTKLRKRYNLVQAPYNDAISHFFCPCCSLCQEFRELQSRELDPALGWNGILAKQRAKQKDDQTLKNPPTDQVMSK